MSNNEAVAATGKSSIGDERNFVAEPSPHDGACRTQHFPHSGTTARTFVANHHDIARFDLAGKDRSRGAFFTIKNSGSASEAQSFLAGDLRNRAFRREVAVHHHEVTVLFDRIR